MSNCADLPAAAHGGPSVAPLAGAAVCHAPTRLAVEVIDDPQDLAALRPTWNALWAADPSADVFSSHGWFCHWWRHFSGRWSSPALLAHDGREAVPLSGGHWRLHVCVVRELGGAVIALWPLVCVHGEFRHWRGRVLSTPVNNHAPRSGLLASRFDSQVAGTLCAALCKDRRWDFLLIDGLRADTGRFALIEHALRTHHGLPQLSSGQWAHSVLSPAGPWQDLLAQKSQNFRRKLAKSRRSLDALGALTFECHAGPEAAERGFKLFAEVDRASWKALGGEVVDTQPELRAYYQGLLLNAQAPQGAEVWVLRVGGALAAACICLNDGRCRYTLKASFSLQFSGSTRFSPSQLLIAEIIRRTCDTPSLTGVDFVARIALADRWANQTLPFGHAMFCRSRLTALRARWRHAVATRLPWRAASAARP